MAIKQDLKQIANAIRSKTGKNNLMTVGEMPTEIESLVVKEPEEPIDNEESSQALQECLETIADAFYAESLNELNIDRTFKFKDADFEYVARPFTDYLDAEIYYNCLIPNLKPDRAFSLDFEFSMHTPAVVFEAPEGEVANAFEFFEVQEQPSIISAGGGDASCCGLSIEQDAETGDSRILFDAPDKPFTGSLRVVFDGSKYVPPEDGE